jgi:hypothetical protein
MTTDITEERDPLSLIEDNLMTLDGATELLWHLASSKNHIGPDSIFSIEQMVKEATERLRAAFNGEFQERREIEVAHEAALADAKAAIADAKAEAAPGSPADIERAEALWSTLRSLARMAIERCDAAQGPTTAGNPTD